MSNAGQVLITGGVIVLLFVAYELWWTGMTTRHDQQVLLNSLTQQWRAAPAHPGSGATARSSESEPSNGSGFAILRIPRLGAHYSFVIVQGTSTADLIKGPGHYPETAMPGQVGNFVVAGHRTTYLHPFYNLNELTPGDAIVVETRTTWFTYRVANIPGTNARYQEVVAPTDVSVSYPVPDQHHPNAQPSLAVLTLTSCNPRYSAAQRLVVHAILVAHQPKSAGSPPALTTPGIRTAVH